MALVHALAAAALLAPLPSSAGDLAGRPDTKGPTASSKTALPTVGPYRCNTPTDSIYDLHRGARHTFKKLHIVSAGDGTAPTVSAATSEGPFSPAKVVQAGVVRGVDILEWQGERFALGLTPSDHMNAGVVVEGGQPLEREAAELTRSELHGDQHGRCRGAYALLESPQQRVVDFSWFEAHSSTIGTASNTPVIETMFSDRTSNPNMGLGWVFWVAPQGRWFSSLVERADSERDQLHIPFAATLPTKPSITHNRGM